MIRFLLFLFALYLLARLAFRALLWLLRPRGGRSASGPVVGRGRQEQAQAVEDADFEVLETRISEDRREVE